VKRFVLVTLCLWASSLGAGSDEVVEVRGNGEINWTQGLIIAKGSGVPPREVKNIAQARLLAERAALADARRNLLETLKGVRVDSATLVDNFMVKDDQIRLQAEGIVQGSVEWRHLRKYLSDGAIEVTVAMSLSGDILSLMLKAPVETGKAPPGPSSAPMVPPTEKRTESPVPPQVIEEKRVVPPSKTEVPEKKPEKPVAPAKPEDRPLPKVTELPPFTGLVIDTRGLHMKPALIPRILDEGGRELYRGQYVPQEKAVQNGLALFSRDLTAAQTNPRVGKNPLTLKGYRVVPSHPSDIILSQEEAKKLAPFAQKGTFLEDCKVMIVLD